jgi:nucleoid-associated protein EbfC
MDLMRMMKQAQDLQKKMQDAQAELERAEVEGASGGGLVKVTMSAKGDLKAVRIDPSLMKPDEAEILEDLLLAAHADARRKGTAMMEERMKAMTGGLQLPPGMKLPF